MRTYAGSEGKERRQPVVQFSKRLHMHACLSLTVIDGPAEKHLQGFEDREYFHDKVILVHKTSVETEGLVKGLSNRLLLFNFSKRIPGLDICVCVFAQWCVMGCGLWPVVGLISWAWGRCFVSVQFRPGREASRLLIICHIHLNSIICSILFIKYA